MRALARPRRTALAVLAILVAGGIAGGALSATPRVAPTWVRPTAKTPVATALQDAARRLVAPRTLTLPSTSLATSDVPTRAQSNTLGTPCSAATEVRCAIVTVPLDRTGVVPGTIDLHVQMLPALGVERGVVFLIAGGPGQGSAHVFGLQDPSQAWYYELLFPGYTLVAVDNRGTGESGLLDCPTLQVGYPIEEEVSRVKACGDRIGPNRVFYTTRDHAEDLEAVRVALGVPKIALWGTSYGTKLALAYALAHPGSVDRLLLDSVVPPDEPDPYAGDTLRAMPKSESEFCAQSRCKAATNDFAGELATLANSLAVAPAEIEVTTAGGSQRTVRVTGLDLLAIAVEGDLNPGIEAELPAVINAAVQGDLEPLGRLYSLYFAGLTGDSIELSSGLFAATVCADGPLPWTPEAAIETRAATYAAGAAALPPGSLGPFGTWSAEFSNAHFCVGWPSPTGSARLGPGPLPNVPMLAVTGGLDMRTPSTAAYDIASRFPQGKVIVVPAVGHSVLSADPSYCAALAVREWMLNKSFAPTCARAKSLIAPVSRLTGFVKAAKLTPKQTLAAVRVTVGEAEAMLEFAGSTAPGLSGGTAQIIPGGVILKRYSVVPGVELSGVLTIDNSDFPIRLTGPVAVAGTRAADGVLGLGRTRASGALGGTVVG